MTAITFDPVAQGAPMAMRCPKCAADMVRYERSGVVVDQCVECRGMFLDRGELERLLDAEAARPLPATGPKVVDQSRPGPDYRSEWDAELDHRPRGAAPWEREGRVGWDSDDDDDRRDRWDRKDHWDRQDHWDRRDQWGRDRRPRRPSVLSELLERIGD
jgi:Zn-finger nucleic acid-binding protein